MTATWTARWRLGTLNGVTTEAALPLNGFVTLEDGYVFHTYAERINQTGRLSGNFTLGQFVPI